MGLAAGALFWLGAAGCRKAPEDEAKLAGLSPNDFPQITADVFKPMDGGIKLPADAIRGRNAWNLWTGGNQQLMDRGGRLSRFEKKFAGLSVSKK